MVLDYGIYLSQQFKICLVGANVFVATRKGIEIRVPSVRIDETHQFLHHILEGTKVPVNFVDKIIDDNHLIFQLDGALKTNLKLYLSFRRRGAYLPKVKCNGRQRFLLRILEKSRRAWSKLLEIDVLTFSRACNTIGFDAKSEFGLTSEKLDLIRGNGTNRAFASNVHHIFCQTQRDKRDGFIDRLGKSYKDMLECIFNGKTDRLCDVCHPFYLECDIYNRFIGKKEVGDFGGLVTLNERGVIDFVASNQGK